MGDDAERAQWEQASRVRLQREAEARARAASGGAAGSASDDDDGGRGRRGDGRDGPTGLSSGRTSRRVAVVAVAVVAVFLVAVGGMLVAIRHKSSEQPAWVAELGLNPTGGTGDGETSDAPGVDRFGSGGTVSPAAAPGGSTSTTAGSGQGTVAPKPPLINTSGEDFDQVWRQIEVLEGWLLEHPAPALAADIYVPGTAPYDELVKLLQDLQSKGQSGRVDGYQILGVTVDGRPSADQVELRYADTYTDRLTLDASGTVIAREPYDGRARLWTLTLQRGDDHRWRVSASSFVSFGDVVPPATS